MNTVSVHIVTYNSESDIEACIEAVFKQTYPVHEVLVIDNNSVDSTRSILELYSDRIQIVGNSSNNGFAAAHNQAIRLTHTDFCLILNPDVTLHPDYLLELFRFIEEKPRNRVGSLTGKLLLKSNPLLVDSCGICMSKARRAYDLGNDESAAQWSEFREVFGVSGAAALYSRAMINAISYKEQFFDNNFFAYKEDVDVAWRAQLLGWKAVFVPKAIGHHERGWKVGTRKRQSMFVRRLSYINRYKMIIKNDSLSSICKHIFPIVLYECMSFGYVILREPKILLAWKILCRDWKQLREWRKFIMNDLK